MAINPNPPQPPVIMALETEVGATCMPQIMPRSTTVTSLVQNIANITQSLRRVVSSRGGQRWQIELTFPPLSRNEATELWTFLNAQSGRLGAFNFILPNQPQRGTMAGVPRVAGDAQSGNLVTTVGWPQSSANVLRVGDFIRFSGHYKTYQVTADVSSGTTGYAHIPVFPALHAAPFSGSALIADNRFRCSLTTDETKIEIDRLLNYGLTATLIEVLT